MLLCNLVNSDTMFINRKGCPGRNILFSICIIVSILMLLVVKYHVFEEYHGHDAHYKAVTDKRAQH